MTTYTMTIEGLKPKQVLDLLDVMPFVPIHVTKNKADDEPKAKGKAKVKSYGKPDDVLSLTGKTATKGSAREKILTTLEKMEVKSGIGSVTRKMLRDECTKKGQDSQIIYQLIREGYMKTIGEQ